MAYPIDCFFRRALRFRSDDHVVRMIYAQYLARHGREGDAMQQLDYVAVKATDSPLTLYNLALSYLELKANDKAWAQAKAAAELGVDLEKTELHARLVAAGAWRDPATEATAPSSPASASDKAAAAPGPARQ
jgi:predicted Zn-dependent protease